MKMIETKRRNIEMQGFVGLDDETIVAIDPWLRLVPAVTMVGTGIGTMTASPWILWGLVPFAIAGIVLRNHPFDVVYDRGVRHFTGGPRLPRYAAPRRFALAAASVWLLTTGWAFQAGHLVTGYVLGCLMFGLAEVVVLTGFCPGAWIHSRLFARSEAGSHLPAPSEMFDR